MKKFDLLRTCKAVHPDGVVEGERQTAVFVTLMELPEHWQVAEMVNCLKECWQPAQEDTRYEIDFQGIGAIAPSVTRLLVASATEIAIQEKTPVVLTNVQRFARESLETEALYLKSPPLWIIDEEGAHLIGKISRKLKRVLEILEEQGAASASQIASSEGAASKKHIGNVSVYLNNLFNAGLVGREKINALERDNAERGWTYVYKSAPSLMKARKAQ